MRPAFRKWLEQQNYKPSTCEIQLNRGRRIEAWHGNLDEHYDKDRMQSLMVTLSYSIEDEQNRRPAACLVPINGSIREGIASLRGMVVRYKKFREATKNEGGASATLGGTDA